MSAVNKRRIGCVKHLQIAVTAINLHHIATLAALNCAVDHNDASLAATDTRYECYRLVRAMKGLGATWMRGCSTCTPSYITSLSRGFPHIPVPLVYLNMSLSPADAPHPATHSIRHVSLPCAPPRLGTCLLRPRRRRMAQSPCRRRLPSQRRDVLLALCKQQAMSTRRPWFQLCLHSGH